MEKGMEKRDEYGDGKERWESEKGRKGEINFWVLFLLWWDSRWGCSKIYALENYLQKLHMYENNVNAYVNNNHYIIKP